MTVNEYRIFYWYTEGIKIFNKWLKTKDEDTWGAFCCCSAAITEFDKKHKDKKTQKLQKLAWNYGYLKGDCERERLEKSGYFDEKLIENRGALA